MSKKFLSGITIAGGELNLNNTINQIGDIVTRNSSTGLITIRTASQILNDIGISGTTNFLSKFTSSGLTDSKIFDNGTNIGIGTINPISFIDIVGNSISNINIFNIRGLQGQLISVTDSLTGVLMSVNDISGIPILEVSSDNTVKMGAFSAEGLIVSGSTVNVRTPIALNQFTHIPVFTTDPSTNSSLVQSVTSNNLLSGIGAVPTGRTLTLSGTTNQVNISSPNIQDLSADRTWTLSLPQDIHTGATPTFAGLTVNGNILLGTEINKATLTYITNQARTYTIPDSGTNADFVMTAGNQTLAGTKTFSSQLVSSVVTGTAPFSVVSTTRVANLNVATAGTADVWTSARNFTIGNTTRSVDGSTTYTWTLNDIGAEPSFNKGNIVQGDGLTLTGTITSRLISAGDLTFAVDSTVVRTSGNQTIGGVKTFTSGPVISENNATLNFSSTTGNKTISTGGDTNLILSPGGTGNVGIGTISPSSLLHIEGSVTLRASSGTTATHIPVFTQDPTSTARTLVTRTPVQLLSDSLVLTTIGNSGTSTYNTATGTINIPEYTLSGLGGAPVSGSTNYIQNQFISAQSSSEAWLSGRFQAGNIRIDNNIISSQNTNGNIILNPNGNGFIGINTTSPTNTLDINGTLKIRTINNGSGDFLTVDSNGVVIKRTANQTLIDIDAVPYTGATKNVNLGNFGLSTNHVDFSITPTNLPTTKGTTYWDIDDNTLATVLNGYIMKIGEDQFYPVKNQTGSNIPKGTAVRFAGTLGMSGRLLIERFIADGSIPSTFFMGVTAENINNGDDGKVLWFGRIRGINTNAFNEGDVLYASTTVAGEFQTAIPQAPNNIVQVAAVITKSTNVGTIFVRPTFGVNINSLEGVKITSGLTGDILQLQANNIWENKTKAQYLGGTSSQFVKGDGTLDSTVYVPTGRTLTLSGTTNQVNISSPNVQDLSANRTWTLSLPQNIHTGATPTFAGLTVNGSIGLRASATSSVPTQIPVFTANPATTTRTLVTRTPAQFLGDLGGLPLSGGTMSGFITLHADPTQPFHAATKQYVDSVAEGLFIHPSVAVATTDSLANLSGGSVVYNNGTNGVGATLTLSNALNSIDGYTLINNDRVLIKDETNKAHNGIYVRTSSTVFTRAEDQDTAIETQAGDFVFVVNGTLFGKTGWVQTLPVDIMGTDPLEWIQFSGAGVYVGSSTITLDGNSFKFRDSVGLSVVGRSINTTGEVGDIIASSDDQVLRRSGTSIGFGAINLASNNAVTNTLPVERGGSGATTLSGILIGNGTNPFTAVSGTSLQYLRGDGTLETFPTIGNGSLTLQTTGIASGGTQTFTANQTTGTTFTVNVPGTNISQGTRTSTTVPINSSTGTGGILDPATSTFAGVMTASDKSKLDSIAIEADKYNNWKLQAGTGATTDITSGLTVTFSASSPLNVTRTTRTIDYSFLTQTANTIFAGPISGVTSQTPTFRTLVPADIPNLDTSKITSGILPIARGGTNSGTALNNNRIMISSGGSIVEATAITANRALISNANGIPVHSTVTNTELGHLSGVTSNIQVQLNGKLTSTLNSANIFVGNSSNVATATALSLNATGGTFALSNTGELTFPNASTNTRGLLTSADWNTFNGKENVLTFSTGLSRSGNTITNTITQYTDALARASISLTTTGTTGSATYNSTTGVFNIPQYQGALTNPVTGTGTAGQVSFWTGTTTQTGDSNLFWNNTDKRLGIGSNTPTNTLDVNGSTRIRTINNGIGDFLTVDPNGVVTRRTGSEILSDINITGTTNFLSKFTSTGLTDSRIFDDGTNIGINTTTPDSILNIVNILSGTTKVLNVEGLEGQLAIITDNMVGVLFSVNDISGIPILEVSSDNTVKLGTFGSEGLIVSGSTVNVRTPIASSSITHIPVFTTDPSTNNVLLESVTPSTLLTNLNAVPTGRTLTLSGTTNQVNVSSPNIQDLSDNRTWTLSLPQDIHTGATPTFAGLTVNGTTTTNTLVVGTQASKATISYTTNTARTLTIPSLGGNRTFAFINEAQTFSAVQTFSSQLVSSVATGTAPFSVASTTRVSNLNVATAGTADVWTTARNFTIGNTTRSVDGSITYTWTVGDIGAVPTGRTLTLSGTTNQINISSPNVQDLSADRTWTLSLPQNIHTGATPTFAGMTVNGSIGLRASSGSTSTHIPVFTADPTSTTRTLVTRTPAQLLGDIGAVTNTLASANIFVGNSSNVATATALSLNATGGTFALSNTGELTFPNASTNTRGLLTSADWNTFNSKENVLTFSTGLSRSGNTITNTITQYTDALARASISLTTTGTTGSATYNSTTGVFNIPQYQGALTNPVTGTGTAGQVSFWTGTTTQTGDSKLTFNSSTGLLTLNGDLQLTGAKTITTNTDVLTLATGGGNGNIILSPNGTGNVGINTTTPTEKLDINGNVRIRTLGTTAGDVITANVNGVLSRRTSSELLNDIGAVPTGRTLTLSGTTNQVNISSPNIQDLSGDRTWTLSLPQDIHTGATPTFAGLTLNGNLLLNKILLSNQENLDVDSGATRVIGQVSSSIYQAVFFDFVIKKGNNMRAGTIYSIYNGTDIEFTETSTNDIGDTSEVVLSVDVSGGNIRLVAVTQTNDWSIKTLIRSL